MFSIKDIIYSVQKGNFYSIKGVEATINEDTQTIWFYDNDNDGIVFKLYERESNQYYYLKCYYEKDDEVESRLRYISDFIYTHPSPYWIDYNFISSEIYIEREHSDELSESFLELNKLFSDYWVDENTRSFNRCNITIRKWIQGQTLLEFIGMCCKNYDRKALCRLSYTFDQMAIWILNSPFAHGNITHSNIIVDKNNSLALIEYENMFIPGLIRESLITETSKHPKNSYQYTNNINSQIDEINILILSISIRALAINPELFHSFNKYDNLLFLNSDFLEIDNSTLIHILKDVPEPGLQKRLNLLQKFLENSYCITNELNIHLQNKELSNIYLFEYINKNEILIPSAKYFKDESLKWGYCNKSKEVVVDFTYDAAYPFQNELAKVRRGNKVGYISLSGSEVIPCIYDHISDFENGYAEASLRNLSVLIRRIKHEQVFIRLVAM